MESGGYCGLNEVAPPLSAAVPDMLELQYELESKAAKWYATTDIANAVLIIKLFLSQPTSVTLLILSPIYRWGSERATVWG